MVRNMANNLNIDDDFCRRFIESLPKQQVGWDDEKGLIALSDHWVSSMIDENLEDPACSKLVAFVKANQHLFFEYAVNAGTKTGLSQEEMSNVIVELVVFFCYKVLKQAHIEAEDKKE